MEVKASNTHQPSQLESFLKQIEYENKYKNFLAKGLKQYGIAPYKISTFNPVDIKKMYEKTELRYKIYEPNYKCFVMNQNLNDEDNRWFINELKIFIWIAVCFSYHQNQHLLTLSENSWQFLNSLFYYKSNDILEFEIRKLIRQDLRQSHRWLKTQEKLLNSILQNSAFDGKWNEISKQFFLKSNKKFFRKPQQLREHWFNHLNPALSQEHWTLEEDLLIMKQSSSTNKKWADISKTFKGARNEHQIKNRYRSLLKKFDRQIKLNSDEQPEIIVIEQLTMKQSNNEVSDTNQNSYSDFFSGISLSSPDVSLKSESESDSNSNNTQAIYLALQNLTVKGFENTQQFNLKEQMLIQIHEDQFFQTKERKSSMFNDDLDLEAQKFFTF